MKYISISVSTFLIFNLNPASAFDSTPPKVISCNVSPKSLPSTGGTLTVTAQISAVNELDRPVIIRMMNREYNRWIADVISVGRVSGDYKLGNYSATFQVVANLKPDRYFLNFDALWDKAQNSDRQVYQCPNVYVDYGGYLAPAATPTPTPSPLSDVNNQLPLLQEKYDKIVAKYQDSIAQVGNLAVEINALKASLKAQTVLTQNLNGQLKKICGVKPKPKGC